MYTLNLSENIIRLRHDKKITQEQLADFVGVTKASVSKWETKQSMPDILLLPQLAAFFDVTIDELLGYAPQLSKEQMQKIYLELTGDFARSPFEEVIERVKKLEKEYYSCYPFLYQLVLLYLNHFMLAGDQRRQQEVLEHGLRLCDRILAACKDITICNETVVLRAMILLQLGKTQEVVESLEEIANPVSAANQSGSVLVQAYQLAGNLEKADYFTQINIYNEVLALVGWSTEYIAIHSDNLAICEETIRRVDMVANAYDLIHLNGNCIAVFWYQAAIMYCTQGKKEKALAYMESYVKAIENLLAEDVLIFHGDSYFTKLDQWIQEQEFGGSPPRDRKVIWDSAIQAFDHPAFAILAEEKAFIEMKKELIRKSKRCN
ncbi:helix-turn-helix transcriptional regulator [Faecalicatena contorta]|uniref:helix-turn-helix domain-containing protein n=1 Tax=Faecalicatena contorta TaxID=39482 RepID=UPI001F24CFAC|nr:helix-turn-helix transcriptional regulator [Faecalicatena contorta]MCF2680063.1 helix-turn-helix transcriptional regulator [Faecalicatena contorta]